MERKRIVSLALVLSLAMVIGAINLFGKEERSQGTFFEIKSKCVKNQENLFIQEICNQIPLLKSSDDFLSVSLIRNFVHEEVVKFANTKIFKDFPELEFDQEYEASRYFDLFERNEKGALCGATANFLKTVYEEFGLKSLTYNFGDIPGSHVITLVELGEDLYLQDAYFNYTISSSPIYFVPIPISRVLDRYNEDSGDVAVYLSNDENIEGSKTMQQMLLADNSEICESKQNVAPGLNVCRVVSRKLADLNSDPRFYLPLAKKAPNIALSQNPAKFLYSMNEPIGNEALINCIVTKEGCNLLRAKEYIHKLREFLGSVKDKLENTFYHLPQ